MTERERDRRAAEERARKIDALQREQLEAMGQSGMAGYGQMPYPGMMPSPWGMPGMQMPPPMSMYGGYGGMDPQMAAMFAATQAYQRGCLLPPSHLLTLVGLSCELTSLLHCHRGDDVLLAGRQPGRPPGRHAPVDVPDAASDGYAGLGTAPDG